MNSDINMTPFVDVMLVLLVIFMVTSPMMIAGIEVDLPNAKTAPLPGQDEPLVVSIDAKGGIFLQETKIKLPDLMQKIQAILGQKQDTRIFIKGDRSVNYGTVVQVFAELKNSGFHNVAIVTEIEDQ